MFKPVERFVNISCSNVLRDSFKISHALPISTERFVMQVLKRFNQDLKACLIPSSWVLAISSPLHPKQDVRIFLLSFPAITQTQQIHLVINKIT